MELRDEETGQLYEAKESGVQNYGVWLVSLSTIEEDSSKWHPHHNLIVAWARGAEIEHFAEGTGKWVSACGIIYWNPETEYRIKPKESASRMYKELLEMRKSIDSMLEEGE